MTVEWYDKNAHNFHDRIVDVDMSSICEYFLKEILVRNIPLRILDAGCGTGKFIKIFLKKGYKVEAFDASLEMVKIATEFCGQQVRHLTFQEMDYENRFDGIWANASLLHVSKAEIKSVFPKFIRALKEDGIWHLSFKYGSGEENKGERLFNNYDEESFGELIEKFPSLKLIKTCKVEDVRPGRKGEYWLKALCQKI